MSSSAIRTHPTDLSRAYARAQSEAARYRPYEPERRDDDGPRLPGPLDYANPLSAALWGNGFGND